MKKMLLIGLLLLGSITLVGCNKSDEPVATEKTAEQICLERNGQLSMDDKHKELCIFDDYNFCYINDVLCFGLTDASPYTLTHKKSSDGHGWEGVSIGLIRDDKGNFESYRREGERTYYSGNIVLKGSYSGGKMDGERFFYQRDTLQANEIYENGRLREVISCDICGGDIDEDGTIWKLVDLAY